VAVEILDEPAAGEDVDGLDPATDAEHRPAALRRCPPGGQLECIASGLDVTRPATGCP
jgi:hypothetical protein